MKTILFACIHNAGRSQMAAAYFNALADPAKGRAISAGTRPADRVHPVVVEVMGEVGVALAGTSPQQLTRELAAQADLLITLGCGEECPNVPGLRIQDWPIPDPKGRPIAEVRSIREEIKTRVQALIEDEVR